MRGYTVCTTAVTWLLCFVALLTACHLILAHGALLFPVATRVLCFLHTRFLTRGVGRDLTFA